MKKYLLLYSVISLHIICGTVCLTQEQKKAIGMQIWQNEGSKKFEYLAFWNPNESFPSLGIGHFIWYPANTSDIYTQTFPELIDYLQQKHITLPSWLIAARQTGAPWHTREHFIREPEQVHELRNLLFNTIELQVDFIFERLEPVKYRLSQHVHPKKRAAVMRHFNQLKQTSQGIYTLIDYINFKGEGINAAERYNGQGWGLLQVLEAMPTAGHHDPQQTVILFAQTAQKILERRVTNAPANKSHEQKWLAGWQRRINTYLTFKAEESTKSIA